MPGQTPGQELIHRLTEWKMWFDYHKKDVERGGDLKKTTEFLNKNIDGMMELFGITAEALRELEDGKEVRLLLPRGVKVTGDLKKLGG